MPAHNNQYRLPLQRLSTALLLLVPLLVSLPTVADATRYRQWLQDMRDNPRGPFSRVMWFCNDGTVLPPEAYACKPHGGGHQRGQWSERTLELRAQGYLIATFLAGVDAEQWLDDPGFADAWGQLLVERFLVATDDGWILRRALGYRGAIQEEDERAGARSLLLAMLSRPDWLGDHFLSLRTGASLLPHGVDTASVGRVRQWSAALSEDDPGFMSLRVKIHGAPDGDDADRVRTYLAGVEDAALRQRMQELATEIDAIYRAAPLHEVLLEHANSAWLPAGLAAATREVAGAWPQADALRRMALSGGLLAAQREQLVAVAGASNRLRLLDLGLRLEAEHFRAASELRRQLEGLTRGEILAALAAAGDAAYGTGLLNARLRASLAGELAALQSGGVDVATYRQGLAYLGRAPGWAQQALRRYFYPSMLKLGEIEPQAMLFIQDQLRGSPLLFYSQALNLLARDAGRLAGIRHRVFEGEVGTGFTPLNPGLARGTLYARPDLEHPEALDSGGIYLLPETVAELPPVAGILTAGEGNPLSHVQLLARNLGIPNVSVSPQMHEALLAHDGEDVVLAVSPGGQVAIDRDGPEWDSVFAVQAQSAGVRIEPDLDKLDLGVRRIVNIDELSATDSGRSVGPKAAKLAELRKHYPEAVSRGLAIPFGVFRAEALERAHPGGGTVFAWMQANYAQLAALPAGSEEREWRTEAFREELYQLVRTTPLSAAFREELRNSLQAAFGSTSPGLFVRSDTNVEDLAGFTGAGLNLTLPNVVGFDELLSAIVRVWASPFTARAFAWRQSHMTAPEHVYTSILLLESVGSDKSGVLITADIDSGSRDILSVAVNEGLGGAVDGQAAESLRIPLDGGPVRVLATATAPTRRVLDPAGGIREVPASGADRVLADEEIAQLIAFARDLPRRFPPITDESGAPAPADVEFGFLDGELRLFQLRPFLHSAAVAGNSYLRQMDARGQDRGSDPVAMTEVPQP